MKKLETTVPTDIYEMREFQFKDALVQLTTPQLVFDNAHRIYDYLTEIFEQDASDSVLREWAFQYSSDNLTGKNYNDIYNKWMEGA